MIPRELTKRKDRLDWLVANKDTLIAQKKAETKHADAISVAMPVVKTVKAVGEDGVANVTVIINTTNFVDGHKDVHMPGLWKKSLQENKMVMHLQEHQMAFDKIIADGDDLSPYTKEFSWRELGYDYEGKTEALVFESKVRRDRNPFMFAQYVDGRVKNHSVGMQYVKLLLAVNDEDYGAEYEAWEKYYPAIANKDAVGDFFWVVKEAKVIEGSAVPIGSNTATPTLDIKEPPQGTPHEPAEATLDELREVIKQSLKV